MKIQEFPLSIKYIGDYTYIFLDANLICTREGEDDTTIYAIQNFLHEVYSGIEDTIWGIEEILQGRKYYEDGVEPGEICSSGEIACAWINYPISHIAVGWPFNGPRDPVYTDDLIEILKAWNEEAQRVENIYGKKPRFGNLL